MPGNDPLALLKVVSTAAAGLKAISKRAGNLIARKLTCGILHVQAFRSGGT